MGLHWNEWHKPRSHGLTYVNMFFGYTLTRCSAHKPQANKTKEVNYTWIIHIQNKKCQVIRIQVTDTKMLDFMNLFEFRDKNVTVYTEHVLLEWSQKVTRVHYKMPPCQHAMNLIKFS